MKHQWIILLVVLVFLSACGSSAARYNNRGNEDFSVENYDDAMENYTSAQQENPDLAEPYYNAGNTRHRQDDTEKAVAQLEQSLRMADDELAQKSFYNLGNTYFEAEDWPSAIAAYQQALLLNPDDVDAKHNLELALQKQQEQQQQQQQQQGQQGQQQPNQGDQQQDNQGQQGQQQQQQSDQEDDQDQSQGGGQGQQPDQSEQEQQQQPSGGFSREEAEQFLDALGQDSQTLQERLQQRHGNPAPRPEQDW